MSDVLKRKLSAIKTPKPPTGASVEAVLRKTMPRDADAVLSLDVAVASYATALRDKDNLLGSVRPSDLVYLLEGEGGMRGLALLDAPLVAGIIEVQVSGSVSPHPVDERAPTRTDGIVVGEVVDRWLASASAAIGEAGLSAVWPLIGFERVHGVIGRREAELLLEPGEFRGVEISLSLGGGARTGRLRLVAPLSQVAPGDGAATLADRVRVHLPDCQVELRAVLARMPREMGFIRALQEDQVLALPEGSLQKIRLETFGGRMVSNARLGQLGGKKAVRLSAVPHSGAVEVFLPKPSPSEGIGSSDIQEAGLPGLPDPVSDPAAAALPDPLMSAPALPDLPDLPEPSALPDLPGLPELPDLPELT